MENLNLQLFSLMNAGATVGDWEMRFAVFAAEYLIYAIPLSLVCLWLWGDSKQRSYLLLAAAVAFLALFVNQLVGLVWFHPRPSMLGIGHTFLAHALDSSFPSDHMTVFWAVGLTLLCNVATRLIGLCTMAAAIAVAWTRIFLGVHFPFDMLGAMAISTTCLIILIPIRPWLARGLLPLAEKLYRTLLAKPIQLGWIRR